MSIHVKDSTITFTWAIGPTASPPAKPDFDVTLILPDKSSTYTDDGLTTYIAPTATAQGIATYDLVLNTVGHYEISLSIGTAAVHIIDAQREVYAVIAPYGVLTARAPCDGQGPAVIPPADPVPSPDFEAVVMARMNGAPWSVIDAVGRGPNQNEIMFVGNAPGGGGNKDIGILDVTTGDVTTYIDAIPIAETNGRNIIVSGIDCDRSTGRIVIANKKSHLNFYPAFYADSITGPWAQCSSPTTQFRGATFMRFDDVSGHWYWDSGGTLYLSGNGANFNYQTYTNTGGGQSNVTSMHDYMDIASNPMVPSACLSGDPEKIWKINPSIYGQAPIPSQEFVEVANTTTKRIFGYTQNAFWHGGIAWVQNQNFESAGIYLMTQKGEVVKNDESMVAGTWQVLAERDLGQANPGSSNELIDQATAFISLFNYQNGQFHCYSSVGQSWWSYAQNEEPAGYGWYNTGGTGFYSDGAGTKLQIVKIMDFANEVHAHSGYGTSPFQYYVYFDNRYL